MHEVNALQCSHRSLSLEIAFSGTVFRSEKGFTMLACSRMGIRVVELQFNKKFVDVAHTGKQSLLDFRMKPQLPFSLRYFGIYTSDKFRSRHSWGAIQNQNAKRSPRRALVVSRRQPCQTLPDNL